MSRALVTGSAGFIGYHLCDRLLSEGWEVTGIDAMTDYYDVDLKRGRLARIEGREGFEHVEARIETPGLLVEQLSRPTDLVVHLAAQAGVRYSIEAPRTYVEANLVGTFELLEALRAHPVPHALLASTSSIYGANTEMPYKETAKADTQMSFYAATKKANEAMAHSYAHLYGQPVTMFRFFTVYGPWGRPDMAPMKFTRAILEDRAIDIYNHGEMSRDFTYVDDLVEGILRLVPVVPERPAGPVPEGDSLSPVAPFRIVNIGHSAPTPLMEFVAAIERATGRTARKNFMEMQPGDVPATWASAELLQRLAGPLPQTPLDEGMERVVAWYREHYGV